MPGDNPPQINPVLLKIKHPTLLIVEMYVLAYMYYVCAYKYVNISTPERMMVPYLEHSLFGGRGGIVVWEWGGVNIEHRTAPWGIELWGLSRLLWGLSVRRLRA